MGLYDKNERTSEMEDLKSENVYLKSCLKKLENQIYEANRALKEVKEKALSVNLSGLDERNKQKMYDIMFTYGIIDSYFEKWSVR